jgi:hypothetical protein
MVLKDTDALAAVVSFFFWHGWSPVPVYRMSWLRGMQDNRLHLVG